MLVRFLVVLGVVVSIGSTAAWVLTGAHRGWSQTQIPETRVDPVTKIEFIEYRDGFVAGIDFFGAGLLVGLGLLGSGLVGSRIQSKKNEYKPAL